MNALTAICPNCLDSVDVESGLGLCSNCNKLWRIPLVEPIFSCEHIPQPVQGLYLFRGWLVEYTYCSGDCKEAAEKSFKQGVLLEYVGGLGVR